MTRREIAHSRWGRPVLVIRIPRDLLRSLIASFARRPADLDLDDPIAAFATEKPRSWLRRRQLVR